MRFRFWNAVAAFLLVVPGISLALGLGEIQLKSTLNAPLNAEIELFATDDELADLQVQMASRDAFTRYGLDYPSFLAGVQVRIARSADGRRIVLLSSTASVTEPFATFLVEASGARGRVQHVYTVLFDPPAFAPQQAAPAPPVAAPTAGGNGSNEIVRAPVAPPAPRPAVAPAVAAPVAAAPAGAAGGSYTVPRGDSLSAIATSHYGESASRQAMVAIFRANPEAFGDNINYLKAGVVLRLPSSAEVAAVDRNAAAVEVRRQMTEWSSRPGGGTAEAGSPRLVLVPPTGGTDAEAVDSDSPAAGASSKGDGSNASDNRVQVGGGALASVQQNAAEPGPPAEAPATEASASGEPGSVDTTAPAEVSAETDAGLPAADSDKPVADEAAAAADESGTSLLDLVLRYKYVLGGLVVLVLALLLVRAARRRRAAAGDSFAPFVMAPPQEGGRDASADTLPLRRTAMDQDRSIVVEENAAPRAPAPRREIPRTVDLEESPAAPQGVDITGTFEQGDPLAEADFHMAYGLYDQAADLVKLALEREPGRRDLAQKLLEVYFVWGNKEQFLQTARGMAGSGGDAPPDWEKVVIMGKQLAPDDPLFSQAQGSVSPGSVDLNLEGGQNLVDFDLPGESAASPVSPVDGGEGDLGLGGLDFELDEPDQGSVGDRTDTAIGTQQLPTQEMPRPDLGIDGPTVEQPMLDLNDTLAGKLGAHRDAVSGVDQTAELALDDLGLDLGKLDSTGSSLLDDSRIARALGASEGTVEGNAETLISSLDETNRELMRLSAGSEAKFDEVLSDLDSGSGDTLQVAGINADYDADGTAVTGTRQSPDVDFDLGGVEAPDDDLGHTQRLDPALSADDDATLRDLEPVSMSEVGTKLDLARAYMDMGDPDGARSILGEVLAEGSPTQRQEAQRLLDSIPG